MDALIEHASRRNMRLLLQRSRRIYGPPNFFCGTPPSIECEIFLGRMPRDCTEMEIIPVLEQVGELFQFKIMIAPDGKNKGFCFAQFCKTEDADRAVEQLHHFEIRQGWRIGVTKTLEKRVVFVKNVSMEKDYEAVVIEVNRIANGVMKVDVPNPDIEDKMNRGYLFIEFESHRSALVFLRKVNSEGIKMWDKDITAEWAVCVPEGNAINLNHLSDRTTKDKLKFIFNKITRNGVIRVDKSLSSAKVTFATRQQAEKAQASMDGQKIDGVRVRVRLNPLTSGNSMSTSQTSSLDGIVPGSSSQLVNYQSEDMNMNLGNCGGVSVSVGCEQEGSSGTCGMLHLAPEPYVCEQTHAGSQTSPEFMRYSTTGMPEVVGSMTLPQPTVFINNDNGEGGYSVPLPILIVPYPVVCQTQPNMFFGNPSQNN